MGIARALSRLGLSIGVIHGVWKQRHGKATRKNTTALHAAGWIRYEVNRMRCRHPRTHRRQDASHPFTDGILDMDVRKADDDNEDQEDIDDDGCYYLPFWHGEEYVWFQAATVRADDLDSRGYPYTYTLKDSPPVKLAVNVFHVEADEGYYTPPLGMCILHDRLPRGHPNIIGGVQEYCTPSPPHKHCVATEWCSGGTLEDWMQQWALRKKPVPDIIVIRFLVAMADAIGFLHAGLTVLPACRVGAEETVLRVVDHEPLVHQSIYMRNVFLRLNPDNCYEIPEFVLGGFDYADTAEQCPIPCARVLDVHRVMGCVFELLCCGKRGLRRGSYYDAETGYETSGLSDTEVSMETLFGFLCTRDNLAAEDLFYFARRVKASHPEMFKPGVELGIPFYQTVVW